MAPPLRSSKLIKQRDSYTRSYHRSEKVRGVAIPLSYFQVAMTANDGQESGCTGVRQAQASNAPALDFNFDSAAGDGTRSDIADEVAKMVNVDDSTRNDVSLL